MAVHCCKRSINLGNATATKINLGDVVTKTRQCHSHKKLTMLNRGHNQPWQHRDHQNLQCRRPMANLGDAVTNKILTFGDAAATQQHTKPRPPKPTKINHAKATRPPKPTSVTPRQQNQRRDNKRKRNDNTNQPPRHHGQQPRRYNKNHAAATTTMENKNKRR